MLGREAELDLARHWVGRLADGPAALVISGEAGIGKSTIWDAARTAAAAGGAQVLVGRPAAAELSLGYAGLGDLIGATLEAILPGLPEPQARAISVALAVGAAPGSGDPLLVARATLAVLRHLVTDGPVVLAIDDVHWLDAPSVRALAFAARRLGELPLGIVVSVRDGHDEPLGLAEALGDRATVVRLGGLSLGATGRLIRSRIDPAIPRHRLLRIHDRSGGNPFYALELAAAGEGRLPSSLEELLRRRLEAVEPVATSAIELVAVLGPSPVSDFTDLAALDSAVAAGILREESGGVRFAHPLLAAAAYGRIPPGRRRLLHLHAAALAEAVETRALHLGLAATDPDAATAQTLEDAARVARLRGAPETAVDLAGHAARLTPPNDLDGRARRMMDQADYLFLAADERGAGAVVEELLSGSVRGQVRVRALVQRALTAGDAPTAIALLEEATAEEHDDRALAARTRAQLAWQRGAWLGDLEPAIDDALEALRMADELGEDATLATALTTTGLVLSLAGRTGAADHFRRALEIIARVPTAAGDHTPRLAFAHERWWRGDFAAAEALLSEERRLAERHGDEGLLMRLNVFGAEFALRRGRWDEAEHLIEHALADARDYWRMMALVRRGILRGRRGDRAALEDALELERSPLAGGDPIIAAAGAFAAGLIALADGDLPRAAELMVRLPNLSDRSGSRGAEFAVLIPETVGVLVEADRIADAQTLASQLERRRGQLTPWGDAASALCRGLLALSAGNAEDARRHLDEACHDFEALGAPWELAQARFAAGVAARRAGQRRRASDALERSASIFATLGAESARRRAEDELRRARPRPRHDDRLTAAESRVAALVAEGRTNREVAARLFTTVSTVEAHLTRIYAKLGVRSRTELARGISDGSLRL